jgi:hypothetical protein
MNLYNTTTNKAVSLPAIMCNGVDCSRDIYGNMDIFGSTITAVKYDTLEDEGADNKSAAEMECEGYDDTRGITWWVNYGNGYNDTNKDVDDLVEEIDEDEEVRDRMIPNGMSPYQWVSLRVSKGYNGGDYDSERGVAILIIDEIRSEISELKQLR